MVYDFTFIPTGYLCFFNIKVIAARCIRSTYRPYNIGAFVSTTLPKIINNVGPIQRWATSIDVYYYFHGVPNQRKAPTQNPEVNKKNLIQCYND